ncbi:MAG: MYXO-CTERM sorting domain-containing protein, partial [Polyangiaceae bacterium]
MQRAPRLGQGKNGHLLLAYRNLSGPPFMSWRAVSQEITTGMLDGDEAGCGNDSECASHRCVDGFCCDRVCDGECESCALTPGTCSPVTDAADDTCFGVESCDAHGSCKDAAGEACTEDDTCASAFCRDGVCCDTSCDGDCESCALTRGTCALLPCAPYGCRDDKSCRSSCQMASDCAVGYQCLADGTCSEPPPARRAAGAGCSCSATPRGGHASSVFGAGVLALLLLLRRRKRGTWLVAVALTACHPSSLAGDPVAERSDPLESHAEQSVGDVKYVNVSRGNDDDVTMVPDGDSFFAVWRHQLPDFRWRALGRRVTDDPDDPALIIADGVTAQALDIAEAVDSETGMTYFLVAWQDEFGAIVIRRIHQETKVLDAQPVVIGQSDVATNVAVASNGSGWLVAWVQPDMVDAQVVARTVDADGTVNPSVAIVQSFPPAFSDQTVRVDWMGSDNSWVVGWREADRGILACTVPRSPVAPCTPFELTGAALDRSFDLAVNGDAVFAAWASARLTLYDVHHSGSHWWAVGNYGLIMKSPDG